MADRVAIEWIFHPLGRIFHRFGDF